MAELPAPIVGETKTRPTLPSILTENLHASILGHLPARYQIGRQRSRSKPKQYQPASGGVTALKTSFSLWDGVRELQRRQSSSYDIQYYFLAFLMVFSLWIAPPAPTLKLCVMLGTVWLLLMPATGQFLRPSMPIWLYLLYFFCSRFIPYDYRPHIYVRVLPALENVLYGANLSNILSAHKHAVLDILAWLPYGIMHFGAPAVCSLAMFLFAAPGTTPMFARCFGWMSILGVTLQICFPCTPPWYENEHGLTPAAYGMQGSPAGLARVDAIFGVDMYTTNFTTAPIPFGAFPSLHAADAVLEALFMSHCFPQFRVFFLMYVGWVWWATMYLSHHYAVDLVGGAIMAIVIFYVARARWIPRRQADKVTRWEYEYVEVGESNDSAFDYHDNYFHAELLSHRRASSSSGLTMESGTSWGSSSGTLSPATSEATTPGAFNVGIDSNGQLWDGATPVREVELHEVVIVR